jgi:hypothetical protein
MVPGVVRISTALPGTGGLSQVGAEYAGIVLVSARPTQAAAEPAAVREAGREPGAILSVMRPLVEGAGGALHALVGADGLPIYRLALPRSAVPRAARPSAAALAAADLARYVASWTVVLAAPETKHKPLQDALQQYGARVRRVTDIASVLAYIEEERPPDAMILDDYVLLHEPRAVLLALIKLCPSAATVVLAPVSSGAARGVAGEAVFLPPTSEPGEVVLAMVEARTLAAKRRPRPA